MSDIKPCVLAGNRPAIIAIAVGIFVAGIGIGYVIFANTYNPYTMMNNPAAFNQMMGNNQQFSSQYMRYMIQDPQLRQQMYNYMFQNKDFMYSMMGNQTFQNQYMGPWIIQNPNFQQQTPKQGISSPSNNLGSGMMGG